VPVSTHLADQLLLPLAMAGGGSFVTHDVTEHTRTNVAIIAKFLSIPIELQSVSENAVQISIG
jgi:RNA 3'-terminal phosphate cyclase (ATP)